MATPAIAFAQIATECEVEGLTPKNAERIGLEMAKSFRCRRTKWALCGWRSRTWCSCIPRNCTILAASR